MQSCLTESLGHEFKLVSAFFWEDFSQFIPSPDSTYVEPPQGQNFVKPVVCANG
jgi:hypothetical protein